MNGNRVHAIVHQGALALALVALPWSEFLLSNALIILLVNWIWEGVATRTLSARLRRAVADRTVLVWASFFLLHLVGLLWSTDLKWGADLCRILLPVPVFALVLGTTPKLDEVALRKLLLLGAWSTVVSTIACLALRYQVLATGDHRELSPFISHIRLALMLCFAVVVLVLEWPRTVPLRVLHGLAILWALWFLVLLGGISGWTIMPVLVLWMVLRKVAGRRKVVVWSALGAVVVLFGAGLVAVWHAWKEYDRPAEDLRTLPVATAGGEVYFHDLERPLRAYGHHVWVNVADKELGRTWERRSGIAFLGKDAKGQLLKGTLVRYMTSMGLRKDSLGVAALSDEDVRRVEQGIASERVGRGSYLATRLEAIFYEFGSYRANLDANAHSITMRGEFLRTGWSIVQAHWCFGVGTGDTQRAFDAAYAAQDSPLLPQWRLRAHDQYLTWAISFGLPGLAWCLFAWWWPAWRHAATRRPLFVAWAVIVVLSCLTEDTLETQMGATFAALYYALFVFAAPLTDRSGPSPAPERSA